METGSWTMPLCATVFLSMSAVTTSGLPEITGGGAGWPCIWTSVRPEGLNVTDRESLEVSPVNGLVFHSAYVGGMNALTLTTSWPSTSKSRYPRDQYWAGDPTGLQPIPEHSWAGNQLTEGSDKRRRNKARHTGSNGIRRDANPIVTQCPSALHRCYNITAAKAYKWFRSCKPIYHAVSMGRKLKANNVLYSYLQNSLHLFKNSGSLCNVFIWKKIFAKRM